MAYFTGNVQQSLASTIDDILGRPEFVAIASGEAFDVHYAPALRERLSEIIAGTELNEDRIWWILQTLDPLVERFSGALALARHLGPSLYIPGLTQIYNNLEIAQRCIKLDLGAITDNKQKSNV